MLLYISCELSKWKTNIIQEEDFALGLASAHHLIWMLSTMVGGALCCGPQGHLQDAIVTKDKVVKCACEIKLISQSFSRMVNENPSDSVSGLVCALFQQDSSAYFLILVRFNRMCLDISISKKKKQILVSAYLIVFFYQHSHQLSVSSSHKQTTVFYYYNAPWLKALSWCLNFYYKW